MTEQQTIKKIQEAVPEIIWVKCSVCKYIHPQGNYGYCNINGCQGFLNYLCEKGERDITLEDCLIAYNKKYVKSEKIQMRRDLVIMWLIDNWKLNIPFHEQSDDTKKFIGNLLK